MISRLFRPACSLQKLSRGLFSVGNFSDLNDLNEHMNKKKPSFALIYFRAGWNPQCEQTDRHIEQLSKEHKNFEIVKVDSGKSPMIARHYCVKAEPQFVVCLFGDEFARQVGPNLPALKNKLERAEQLSTSADLTGMQNQWVPYGTSFNQYYDSFLQQRLSWNK